MVAEGQPTHINPIFLRLSKRKDDFSSVHTTSQKIWKRGDTAIYNFVGSHVNITIILEWPNYVGKKNVFFMTKPDWLVSSPENRIKNQKMGRGIAQEYLDKTVDPADDFYMFVNGGWMKSTDIPEDRSSWGSFHELAKNTDQKVLDILTEELERKGPAENKAARLFEAGMNTQQIEKAKLNAIQSFLEQTKALSKTTSIPSLLGMLTRKGLSSLIHFSVHPDLGNSKI